MTNRITKACIVYGIGDALNARAFLITYCKQKHIARKSIRIYSPKYWWMFEGLGFLRGTNRRDFFHLTPYRNFGRFDLPKKIKEEKLDACIAKNAGIKFSFDTIVPLPRFKKPNILLPKKYITFNTGFNKGYCMDYDGDPKDIGMVCLKAWPAAHWEKLISLLNTINIKCIQIGAGKNSAIIPGTYLNLVDKLSITQSAEVLRNALFHIDIEGGLPILNQHLNNKSVVLFGPTAIEQQGRSFNLNLKANTCNPCYEWGIHRTNLGEYISNLPCKAHCMSDLTPEYVFSRIRETFLKGIVV